MAYSTLVSLEQTIDQILDHDRYSISSHEKQQLIYLDKYVISFQAFLENFPERGKDLEARIRDAATEAQVLIEWFMLEQIWRDSIYSRWIAELRGIKYFHQLQKVRDTMTSIVGDMVEISSTIMFKDVQTGDSLGASSSSIVSGTGKMNMIDEDKDLVEIIDRLYGGSKQLLVIPIFGMGGIGKSTLARNAYDDQLIMEHFQIRVWVTVSQVYSDQRILSNLLDSIKEFVERDSKACNGKVAERSSKVNESQDKIPEQSISEMAEKVYKTLACRRFLIVMDDMWSTKLLDDAKRLFPDYNNGSRIMLTTRLRNVAAHANSSVPVHHMRLMDGDQSWNLLQQKLESPVPRGLDDTGMEIAKSCRGLPLAIAVVAGLLSTVSKSLSTWKEIAKNVKSSLAAADGQIEQILCLSYNHLPHRLRPCFLYLGGFPEDRDINVTNLIRLWIAEGFVKTTLESKRHEDVAEEYFEELVDRSLILVMQRNSNGRIKSCRLHDMVREMCIRLSQEEKFIVHVSGRHAQKLLKSMTDQRRISISHSDLRSFDNAFSSTVCTIMYFQNQDITHASISCYRLLRVLDLLSVRFESDVIPDQFFQLFHLRYLAFFYNYKHQMPRAISNLQNLQTLIIHMKEFDSFRSFPHEF